MSLRINHNTSSLNSHRNLKKANTRVAKSLERLSSGMRINSAGDGAAELMASEQLRAQIASIDQAIRNSESSISMVQTAEGALAEANNTLVEMRQLALQSANEGANDAVMLAANQTSIDSMIESIDRVAEYTQFGQRKLLNGSNGVPGLALGEGLQFIIAATETQSSGVEGYDVVIESAARKASLVGTNILNEELINAGEKLYVMEDGKTATYITKQTDSVDSAIQHFAAATEAAGLDVTVSKTDDGRIKIEHNQYGSESSFIAASTTTGVLSQQGGVFSEADKGADLKGKINGETTIGKGITMTGLDGNPTTSGLMVSYQQPEPAAGEPAVEIPQGGLKVGTVVVEQNALQFQIGPDRCEFVNVALHNTAANALARGVQTDSGFQSLADVDVSTAEHAADALALIDEGLSQVTKIRADLGAFQNNTLAINIANMQIAKENMVAAESTIRDTDMAEEMAKYTRNDLLMQSSAAMLAQANQVPAKVLRLLE